MTSKKQKWILYLITITIFATIAIQFYWNYKNYEENKRQVTNEIQLSLDNAVEEYYSSLAKSNFLTIIENKPNNSKTIEENSIGKILQKLKENNSEKVKPKVTINNIKITSNDNLSKEKIDSMMNSTKEFVTNFNTKIDSVVVKKQKKSKVLTQLLDSKQGITINNDGSKTNVKYFKGKKAADSLKLISNLKPIFISFLDESIAYDKIDSLIKTQLSKKEINTLVSFQHYKNDTLFKQTNDTFLTDKTKSLSSKSTYVKKMRLLK